MVSIMDGKKLCGNMWRPAATNMCLQCLLLLCTWQLGVLGMPCHKLILFLHFPLLALAWSSDGACNLTLPPEPWWQA